jgi:hypothetical protein
MFLIQQVNHPDLNISIHLLNHLDLNKLFHEHQYGFQKGKSLNITNVTNYIFNALNAKLGMLRRRAQVCKFIFVEPQCKLGSSKAPSCEL